MRESIDADFFHKKLDIAQRLRRRLLPNATSFRWVSAEGDGMSGLILDKYDDILLMQISSLGIDQRKAQIIEAIHRLFKPTAILERCDFASRKMEGLSTHQSDLSPARTQIQLNDLLFEIDFQNGHKTGFYLDQQENYILVTKLMHRWNARRILDCFTYQGGFALHAARLPDRSVLAMDQSQEAIDQAIRNASANHLNARCEFRVGNVFDWLKQAEKSTRADSQKFDAIVLDPPSFTRNRSSVPDAIRGYKEIHLRALRLLREGGLLFTFCCSHHMDAETFESVIISAALDNRRRLRRIARFGQSADHPILLAIPETEYLKGFAYELLPK